MIISPFKGPSCVNLEILDSCNTKCRHCYNYWRHADASCNKTDKASLKTIINLLSDNGVFHIIFSGGEPLMNFDVLEYGIKYAQQKNISVSCNSNLMLATPDKMKKLRAAGLDHILTSLNSSDESINDYMVNQKGSFKKIINGIQVSRSAGIRISANMIITQRNYKSVYETGKLAHQLGCQKIFGTRVVPSELLMRNNPKEYILSNQEHKQVLNELVQLKQDTGIMIGSLVSYPLCFLEDLETFHDFVGRGCPTQSGLVMNINADGTIHGCVHESKSYGNLLTDGLQSCYQKMNNWYNKKYSYPGCTGCEYLDTCHTGCRMSAHSCYRDQSGKDPLFKGKETIKKPYKAPNEAAIVDQLQNDTPFYTSPNLRFRAEKKGLLINIQWANVLLVKEKYGKIIQHAFLNKNTLTISNTGFSTEFMAKLFLRGVIQNPSIQLPKEILSRGYIGHA